MIYETINIPKYSWYNNSIFDILTIMEKTNPIVSGDFNFNLTLSNISVEFYLKYIIAGDTPLDYAIIDKFVITSNFSLTTFEENCNLVNEEYIYNTPKF